MTARELNVGDIFQPEQAPAWSNPYYRPFQQCLFRLYDHRISHQSFFGVEQTFAVMACPGCECGRVNYGHNSDVALVWRPDGTA